MPKIVGSRDLGHAHFHGTLFVRPLGIPHIKLRTKFEVSSSSIVFEILRSKRIWVTSLTSQGHVTSSVMCDHSIAHIPFPIDGLLEPSLYL